jgi:hypothetical protein
VSPYREQLAAVLGAVTICAPDRYRWLGRLSRAPEQAPDAAARRANLLHRLTEELYSSFYCRGGIVPARWGKPEPIGADPQLTEAITAANSGRGGWETGWRLERLDGDEAVITTGGVRARAPVTMCRGAMVPGATIDVPRPPQPTSLSPGFLTIVGDAGGEGDAGVLRVYWHVTRSGAPELVRMLTAHLNARALPFRFKIVDHALRFDRCDAAVLYLPGARYEALRPDLASIATHLARWLRPDVPPFTLPLAPGVGLAESGGGGESFGERRCSILADGILEADAQGAVRAGERLAAVVMRFARDGVDVDKPYLEPALAGRHVL